MARTAFRSRRRTWDDHQHLHGAAPEQQHKLTDVTTGVFLGTINPLNPGGGNRHPHLLRSIRRALTLVMSVDASLPVIDVFEIAGAWRAPYDHGWRRLLGVPDAVLGGLLLFSGPATGLGFLAVAVGLSFLFRGSFLIILAMGLRRLGNA